MPGMDIFNENAFALTQLTSAVNQQDFVPSRLRSMGLFTPRGAMTQTIMIERKGSSLKLVPTSQRGGEPEQRTRDQRDIRDLRVPRLAKEAVVYADQVQGVRAFGSETELEMVQNVVNQEVDAVRADVDMTEENMMLGAVKGIIPDADGSTIYNLFTEFGVSQTTAFNFALGTDTTDVRGKCQEVKRSMGKDLKVGSMPFEVYALCSDSFFDQLISHPNVKEAYERWQDGQMLRNDLTWDVFPFAGINFENYRGSDDGSSVSITDGEAHFFARGIPNLFEVAYAPADTMETVNTMGLPRYVIPGMDPSGKERYQSFEVQANPLPYCTRPKHLKKATAA